MSKLLAGDPNYSSVKSEMGVNELGVPPRNGMEWPYEIFGVGGDGRGSGAELGFQMLPQFSGNNIGGSSSVNVAPNMIPYNGNLGNFGGDGSGNVRLPQVNYGGNNIMGYFGMLPQYYGNNNAGGSNMGLNFGANSNFNNIALDGASEAAMELTVLVEVMRQAFLIKMLAKLGKTPTTSSISMNCHLHHRLLFHVVLQYCYLYFVIFPFRPIMFDSVLVSSV